MDDLMEYMLLFDEDEEDALQPGKRSGCGCLPFVLVCFTVFVLICVVWH